jgi:hypothetical protein
MLDEKILSYLAKGFNSQYQNILKYVNVALNIDTCALLLFSVN